MYILRRKAWNISVRFRDFHFSAPKSRKYPRNERIYQKFPGNDKLSLEDNKSTSLLQKDEKWSGWFPSEERSFTNASTGADKDADADTNVDADANVDTDANADTDANTDANPN